MNISSNGNPYRQYVAAYKAEQVASTSNAEGSDDDGALEAVKDLACGMLGLDSAADDAQEEASGETGDGIFYTAGQCIKAAGSVAGMISFFV